MLPAAAAPNHGQDQSVEGRLQTDMIHEEENRRIHLRSDRHREQGINNGDDDNINNQTSDHCGHELNHIDNDTTLRVGFININGIPQQNTHLKNKQIFNAVQDSEIDILGMTESNVNWNKMQSAHRWNTRINNWWECNTSIMAFNTTDLQLKKFQPGGTIMTSIGKAAHRVIKQGKDPSNLGRWCWSLYRGKHDVKLRIITLYRPCQPTSAGTNTAYSQQLRYFDAKNDERCPRAAIMEDIYPQLQQWLDEGDQLILMLDANENLRTGPIHNTLQNMGLTNAIYHQHNLTTDIPTYQSGTAPIDGIYTSRTLQPIQSGMAPFGTFPSDHRLLWIDIAYQQAFGFHMPTLVFPSARRLKCSDPRIVLKFQKKYKELLRQNNVAQRLFNLQQTISVPPTLQQTNEYENIRLQCHQFMTAADKQCRKLTMGNLQWSPDLQRERDVITLWTGVIKRRKGVRFSRSKIIRLADRHAISYPLQRTLAEAETELNEAYAKYHAGKKYHKERRTHFLESLAQARAQKSSTSAANQLKQLQSREELRLSFRQIKFALGTLSRKGVTSVKEVQEDGTIMEYTDKIAIEEACMRENERKYTQTESTPCMTEPLLSLLGTTGDSEACNQILNGTIQLPPEVDQYTAEFFNELKQEVLSEPLPSNTITTEEFCQFWKMKKEQISSGISGIHYGHMKACSLDPFLADIEATLAHIPYYTGYTPSSWSFGVDCMIPKKAGLDLVTKLRTIVLCEAGLTFNNSKLAKSTMEYAERNNYLAPEQFGSRNGKKAVDHAVHKRLTYDILRQTRRPGALCSNDAKSCYDRILHSIATMAFRRLGIPFNPVQCMFTSIQHMKHHTRTSFGDSVFTYSAEGRLIPFQGVLQGNAAAPIIWVVVSTPLLNMLRTAGNGAHFISAISSQPTTVIAFAFVDDTDLPGADFRDANITSEEVMAQLQDSIDRWEGGLKATGGAIAPEKSWVYPIDFGFNDDGSWYYLQPEDIDFEFSVRDCNNIRTPLPQINPHKGKETLGVTLAPDGNDSDAVKHMRNQTQTWADHIKTGHLSAPNVWRALNTIALKQIEYPIVALNLSPKDCTSIMAPLLLTGLSRSSICRTMPRAVVHGPTDEGGLGIPNLYVTQGTRQIALLTEHLHLQTMTGQLIRTSIEWAKVELGLSSNLFLYDYDTFSHHLTPCWIKHLWQFCSEFGINIEDRVTPDIHPRRINDQFIMESIITRGTCTPTQLQQLNRCRLYLKVTNLSDITNGYGTWFTKSALEGTIDSTRPTHYHWPIQTRPNIATWRLWRRILKSTFPNLLHRFQTPLGSWRDGERDKWIWFYHLRSQQVFRKFGIVWKVYRRVSQRGRLGRRPKFRYHQDAISLPPGSQRATIQQLPQRIIILTGYGREGTAYTHPPRTQASEFARHVQYTGIQTHQRIITALRESNLTIISDGSYDPMTHLGSAAFILGTDNPYNVGIGKIVVPGEKDTQCSHRSELAGLLGSIVHINHLCSAHDIHQGTVQLGCDGLNAIQVIESTYEVCKSNRRHFDIIQAITDAIKDSPLTWEFHHVKAHQDDTKDFEDLSFHEQLNVIADDQAKQHMAWMKHNNVIFPNVPTRIFNEKCTILWQQPDGTQYKIGSKLESTLQRLITQTTIRQYWTDHQKFHHNDQQDIDWSSLNTGINGLPSTRKRWLSKWMSGYCGIGVKMKQWKFQPHDLCPRCQQPHETINHVLQCPHVEAKHLWNTSIDTLEVWLGNHTSADITMAICGSLRAWHDRTPFPAIQTGNTALTRALNLQDKMGWDSFIDGFQAIHWRTAHQLYLDQSQSQKSSMKWKSIVQRKIWQIAWEMWEHRNSVLHNNDASTHRIDAEELTSEIRDEHQRGSVGLSFRHRYLFSYSLQRMLQLSVEDKKQWLTSVYIARDCAARQNDHIQRQRLPVSKTFYERWRAKHAE